MTYPKESKVLPGDASEWERPNVLYLTHRVPYPPNRGDRIRAYHTLRFLSRFANVHLACLADEPVNKSHLRALNYLCSDIAIVPVDSKFRWVRATASLLCGRSATEGLFASPKLRNVIASWTRRTDFDAVVTFCSSMVQHGNIARRDNKPFVVDLVDVDSEKWFNYASSSHGIRRLLYRLEGKRVRSLEQQIAKMASAVTLVSEAEAALLSRNIPTDNIHALPNGVDLDYFQPNGTVGDGFECVFVGVLDYQANVDGLQWFAKHVWPDVRKHIPNARFSIVGRRPNANVTRLNQVDGITVVGEVPDVRPFVQRANVVVAPLRIARGIQNKVLESFAMNKATVASPGAIEGIAAEPGVHFCLAETASDWTRTIVELANDGERCERLGNAARLLVEQKYQWNAQLKTLSGLLNLSATTPAAVPTVSTNSFNDFVACSV